MVISKSNRPTGYIKRCQSQIKTKNLIGHRNELVKEALHKLSKVLKASNEMINQNQKYQNFGGY